MILQELPRILDVEVDESSVRQVSLEIPYGYRFEMKTLDGENLKIIFEAAFEDTPPFLKVQWDGVPAFISTREVDTRSDLREQLTNAHNRNVEDE